MSEPDVVVVGAGTAGLTAAALLSHHGHTVHVYEPNGWLGGYSGTFEVDGFVLNLGAHVLEDPGSGITAIFEYLGLRLEHGPATSDLPVWDGAAGRWGSIRDLYGGSRRELKKVIATIVNSPWEAFDAWDDQPLRAWLYQHTDDDGVIALFEYIAFLEHLTTDWREHSASDSLYVRKMHFGERGTAGYSCWPKGGWAKLFEDLAGVVTAAGGRVETGVRARVLTEHRAVTGVRVADASTGLPNEIPLGETVTCDAVVVAVPAWHIADAVSPGTFPDWYEAQIDRLADPTNRDSWVNVALATAEPAPIIDRLEMATWSSTNRSDRPGFMFEQTAYDPATAPDGTHLYVAGTAIPGQLAMNETFTTKVAEALEADLAEMMPGLGDPVWQRRQVVFDPSIGVASTPMSVGSYRPHWRAPNVDGLWLAHETLRGRGIEDDRAARAALTAVEDLLGRKLEGLDDTWRYGHGFPGD